MGAPTALTALTSLTIMFPSLYHQIVPHWTFPALRFVKLFRLAESLIPNILPFLEQHRRTLTGLHIRPHNTLVSLPILLAKTSSLQSLTLEQTSLHVLKPMEGIPFPSITHLGILLEHSSKSYDVNLVKLGIQYVLSCQALPGLKMMHLVELEDPTLFGATWPLLTSLCRSQNVILAGGEN